MWKSFKYKNTYYLLHMSSLSLFKINKKFFEQLKSNNKSALQKLKKTDLQLQKKYDERHSEQLTSHITSIALNVTQTCNLACKYCYANEGTYNRPSTMSFKTAKNVINYFINYSKPKKFIISFFGGEPLLNLKLIKKIFSYIKTIPQIKFNFKITTNAVMLNKTTLKYLINNNFYINVSFDGKGIHDYFRIDKNKTGTEHLVIQKLNLIKELMQNPKKYSIRMTINKTHLNQLYDAILDLLYNYDCNIYLSLNHNNQDKNQRFEKKDILKYLKILEKCCWHCIQNKDYKYVLKLANIQNTINAIHLGLLNSTFCGAGINYIGVTSNGNFYLCHRCSENPNFYVGNPKDGLQIQTLKKFLSYRQSKPKKCQNCYINHICGGGCFMDNYCYTHSELHPHPNACLYHKKEFELALKLYLTLKDLAPNLFKKLNLLTKE